MKASELTETDVARINAELAGFSPLTVPCGTGHYEVTGATVSLWDKKGRRLYINPTFSFGNHPRQFDAPWIDLENGRSFFGMVGAGVNSGRKREANHEAQRMLIRRLMAAIIALERSC